MSEYDRRASKRPPVEQSDLRRSRGQPVRGLDRDRRVDGYGPDEIATCCAPHATVVEKADKALNRANKRRKRMPCDPDDIRLLLGFTFAEIERQDQAVKKIIRDMKSEASATAAACHSASQTRRRSSK